MESYLDRTITFRQGNIHDTLLFECLSVPDTHRTTRDPRFLGSLLESPSGCERKERWELAPAGQTDVVAVKEKTYLGIV